MRFLSTLCDIHYCSVNTSVIGVSFRFLGSTEALVVSLAGYIQTATEREDIARKSLLAGPV